MICYYFEKSAKYMTCARFQAAEDNVFRLKISQCMSHLDLELVLARLPNLTSLELIYG